MRIAYDAIILRTETHVLHPEHLYNCMHHHSKMVKGMYTYIVTVCCCFLQKNFLSSNLTVLKGMHKVQVHVWVAQ